MNKLGSVAATTTKTKDYGEYVASKLVKSSEVLTEQAMEKVEFNIANTSM